MSEDAELNADIDLITSDSIDENFVPRQRENVASVELDGESVLAEPDDGYVHCLDAVGTIVWSCFDGSATLDELSGDLAEGFGTDRETVARDVIEFARQLGRKGLLEGVAADKPVHDHGNWTEPEGLPIGTEFAPFELLGLDGNLTSLEQFRGQQVLLVNWSPHCGFCTKIAPVLTELDDDLRGNNVTTVLIAAGTAEDNLNIVREHGLACSVLLQQNAPVDQFAGLGTPVAYLLDTDGRVASKLAVGAESVPSLARQAAAGEVEA